MNEISSNIDFTLVLGANMDNVMVAPWNTLGVDSIAVGCNEVASAPISIVPRSNALPGSGWV